MGIDLTLLPIDYDVGDCGYSHTMLEIGRDYDMYDRINVLNPYERPTFILTCFRSTIPDGINKGEACYAKVTETHYGRPITYVDSKKLAIAILDGSISLKQRAAALYLNTINQTTVALYWH